MEKKKQITDEEKKALADLARRLRARLPVTRIILFGSKVTGSADEESDIDLLILVADSVTSDLRRLVVNETFECNLKFGVNISSLVIEDKEWREGPPSILPFHEEVEELGVEL